MDGWERILNDAKSILADQEKAAALISLAEARSKLNGLNLPEIMPDQTIEQLMKEPTHGALLQSPAGRIAYYLIRRYRLEKLRGTKGDDFLLGGPIEFARTQIDSRLMPARKRVEELMRHRVKGTRLCQIPNSDLTAELCDDYAHKTNRVFLCYKIDPTTKEKFQFDKKDIINDELKPQDDLVDAVVSDPPYGYGEVIPHKDLQRIYMSFFDKSLQILKDGGSLVFCALDKVRTGRSKTELLTTEDVIRMLHDAACKHRIDFAFPSIDPVAEQAKGLFFWKSSSALNRSIFAARIYRQKK